MAQQSSESSLLRYERTAKRNAKERNLFKEADENKPVFESVSVDTDVRMNLS